MKILKAFISLVFSFCLIQGCTYKTTKKKDPIFTKNLDAIARHIHNIQPNEKIEVNGSEVTTNGKISSELIINLINPRNPPTDTGQLKKTGAKIAALVKQVIKNPDDYDKYTVFFTTKVETDILTKTNYVGFDFMRHEINPYVYFVSLGDKLDSLPIRATGKTTFNSKDSIIYVVISDYKLYQSTPLSSRIIKETHPEIVVEQKSHNIKEGGEFQIITLKVRNLYKIKELQTGDYRIEYLANDSVVGAKHFRLE